MCRALFHSVVVILLLGLGAGTLHADPLQQDAGVNGIVSVEAEHFDANIERGGNQWEETGPTGGFTGELGMTVTSGSTVDTPDGYVDNSPRMDYEINFVKSGTHYVWILAWGAGGGDDSCHVGLDGEESDTSDRMSGWNAQYRWSNGNMDTSTSTFEVTSVGVHTLNLYMRENGLIVDKIVLTMNPDYTPEGDGPPESPRGIPEYATNARPADGAVDVPRNVILAWDAGPSATAHDVYFGTVPEDVNDASRDNPLDVLFGQGQAAASFEVPDRLEFGQTYYWRVDELGDAIIKGDLWSFTVEPFTYQVESIVSTASSSDEGVEPGNTVDGSGLDAEGLHTMEETAMWLSAEGAPEPAWIQYAFSRVYKLHEMRVWNYNVALEGIVGLGFKDVLVEYSLDGAEWTLLAETEFARGPAEGGYASNTTVDFGGVPAKYVRLTAQSNWGGFVPQFGLSEVQFFYIPAHPREPQPVSGQIDVDLDTALTWRAGREADSHEVYFSTDGQAVADGAALVETTDESLYDPGLLDFGRTYYWKVVEVNETATPSAWAGDVWNFSTTEYLIVEGFEDYTDNMEDGKAIFQTWIDGVENGTGSYVGYEESGDGTFGETQIVFRGDQSMPLSYTNTGDVDNSEAERTWDTPQDWTVNGIDTLFVHFRGNPIRFVESDDSITMSAAGADIWDVADEFSFAYKPLTGDGSVTIRVDTLEDTDPWAKAGVMIRDGLEANVKNAMVYVTPNGRVGWQSRRIPAGTSDSTRSEPGEITLPYWVRLTRTGSLIRAEHSSDGTNWQPVVEAANPDEPTEREIPMGSTVQVGLALTSHNAGVVNTAEFSNATTTGTAPGGWRFTQIGVDQPLNEPADLYFVLEDNGGSNGVVKHPDPNAVLQQDWQQWAISLGEFANAGVRLDAIKTMYIGVGDRDNPTPDSSGLIYIDEIGVGHRGLSDPGNDGLVAHYPLENSLEDASGNGHDGLAVGELVFTDGPGDSGMALEFDGSGTQYVDLGTFDPSAGTGQLSVSLWVRWNGLNDQYQGLIAKRDGWAADNMMWHLEAQQTTGAVRVGREGISQVQGAPLTEGQWEHWAFTFDGSEVVLYRNALVSATGGFSFGSDREASLHLGVGSINDDGTGTNPYNGALDEVRLYDRVLSPFEVRYLAGQR